MFRKSLTRLVVLTLGLLTTSASAATVTKPFEIGAGTSQPSSQFRTFTLPCRTRMVASVTYSRSGPAGAEHDVPIFVEVREPAPIAEEEGLRVAAREGLRATRTPQTVNLPGVASSSGDCSVPWRVRVKHDAAGPAPVSVSGNITVSFNPVTTRIDVAGGLLNLARYQSNTKNVGDSNGIGQGNVVITGAWNHSILGATGPNPVKLRFEFFDYSGRSVAIAEGYPSNEIRDLPKLRLSVRTPNCAPGQWRLKITNIDTQDDAKDIDINVSFTPDCP